ncbi:uncharacterized protein LOC136037799 [Artemia franciscana]|uniref:RNA helicase n=1 Tax=Artemia franciscana TaxID=6661 RepID=A0AA88I2A8_ARTSF|nr:hypothetical protein QYM36_005797 [Artemia franciscana]
MSNNFHSVIDNNRQSEGPSVASEIVSDDVPCFKKWEDMDLRKGLLQGIYNYGFETPTFVQQKAIMQCIKGKDVVFQAESGTGKTGAYAIATLQLVDPSIKACQAIILATTRELAQQICKVITSLSQFEKIECCDFIGGRSIDEDIEKIQNLKTQNLGIQVAVGTPGRLFELIKSNRYTMRSFMRRREDEKPILNTNYVRLLVIDEADEMLLTNFDVTVKEIFGVLDENIQVVMSSATMPSEMYDIANKIVRPSHECYIKKRAEELTLAGIRQCYVEVEDEEDKVSVFEDLYDTLSLGQCIIFVNKKAKVTYLANRLREDEFTVSEIHSDQCQNDRNKILEDFKSGKSRVLISTDVLSRGIDVQQVKFVINYDLPFIKENYIHRIGRVGRFGRTGVSINFVTKFCLRDKDCMAKIERCYATNIEKLTESVLAEILNTK